MKTAFCLLLVLLLVGLLAASISHVNSRYRETSQHMVSRRLLLQTLGFSSLSLSYECTATRCLTEGLAGCLGDMPGAYCYHTSCDVVDSPAMQEREVFEIVVEAP